jgi:hypothetical protein
MTSRKVAPHGLARQAHPERECEVDRLGDTGGVGRRRVLGHHWCGRQSRDRPERRYFAEYLVADGSVGVPVSVIFHIAGQQDWERASRAGTYTTVSLAEEGFIHWGAALLRVTERAG